MKNSVLIVKCLAYLAFATAAAASAADLYVSTSGSDSNPGTSSQPFRTISYAYSLAGPGTTIIVMPGTYTDAQSGWGLRLNKNGTASAPITLRSQVRGQAIIDGQYSSTRNHGIWLDGSYNVVDGFVITRAQTDGIGLYGSNNQILNNEIHHNGNLGNFSSNNTGCGVVDTGGTSNSFIGNNVHDNGRSGSNLDHGFYLCGKYTTVFNNLFVGNACHGVQVAGYSTVVNLHIYNNVMAYNGGDGIVLWQALSGVDIKNNILFQNYRSGIATFQATGTVNVDHNLFYGNVQGAYDLSGLSYTLGTVLTSNPNFVNSSASTFNAHLSTGSPAIGAGLNLSSTFTTDYTGATRPASGAWDLGVYVGSTTATPPTISSITSQTATAGTATAPIAFTVSDAQTAASSLVVTASSSNPTLVPTANIVLGGSSSSRTVTLTPASGQSGSATITLKVSDGTLTASTSFGLTVTAPTNNPPPNPTPSSGLSFAASAGTLSAPFVASNGAISQSVYSTVATGGRAVYSFNITNAGSYVVSCSVSAPSTDNNSLYVNMDSTPVDPTMIWDIPVNSGFTTQLMGWRGTGTFDANQYTPKVWNLTAGTHQLIVIGREAGVQLASLTITPYGTTPPPSTTPPVVVLTSPANGATYTNPATINLAASVVANGHTLNSVQFFNGTTLLGQSTTAPYGYAWKAMPTGSFNLSAKALYDGSNQVSSAAVTVKVVTASTNTAPQAPTTTLSFSAATAGSITAPYLATNGVISQPANTTLTSGGRAAYSFTLDTAGQYVVSALIDAASTDNNSVWVNIDGEPVDPTMVWDMPVTSGFTNALMGWRGNGTFDNNQYTPKVWNLAAGTHQLVVRGRELNTDLASFTVMPYSTNAPSAPALQVWANASQVQVAWPTNVTGTLQAQPLSSSTNAWTNVSAAPVVSGSQNVVVLPGTAGTQAFRLLSK